MSVIKALAHVCLKTVDLAKTSDFYCDTLGLEKRFDFTRRGKIIGFYIRVSSAAFIEVFHEDHLPSDRQALVLHHFCLECGDLESLRKSLLAKGHTATESKMGCDHSWQFWTQDPSGVAIEFHQYTDQSAQRTGEDIEVDW